MQIALHDSFLVVHSDTLRKKTYIFRRDSEYTFDYRAATLRIFAGPVAAGDTLTLHYLRLPLPLQQSYAGHRLQRLSGDSSGSASQPAFSARGFGGLPGESEQAFGANLQKSGSLVRGLSIGSNQGLRVDSGLRLELSGKISDNMEVVAALTDQNTPIQPEGNTQTLNEIDKVFIELRSSQFTATLGDYNLAYSGTEFARYQRKLQGAKAQVNRGNVDFSLFGAVSRGKFRSQQFLGIEGNQGPYQLTGDRGQIDIIVLAGTERVWIDGIPMVRGETNDYVIEYGNGQITFTRNRLITSDSRISVDFEFSDEQFQRNLFGSETVVKALANRLQVRGTFIREGDDKQNPLGLALNDDYLRALAAAGDSLAGVDGATFVGMGKGSYVKRDSIFVFAGQDSGDYVVRFSDLGEGRGSYQYSGFGHYTFAGPGRGRYAPILLLPKAQRTDLANFRLQFAPAVGVVFTSELALSQFDANLYSNRDENDNGGKAYLFEMRLAPEHLSLGGKSLGQGSLSFRHRRRGDRFREIDRENIIEFGRRWDLTSETTKKGETISEANLRYAPWKELEMFGSLGSLNREQGGLASMRWEVGTRWQQGQRAGLDYQLENIQRRRDGSPEDNGWLRQRGRVHRLFWKLRPSAEFENEVKKEILPDSSSAGFRFTEVTGAVDLENWRPLRARVAVSRREDDNRFGFAFHKRSVATTQNVRLALTQWQNLLLTASYIHRERTFADSLTQDTRTDLAEVRASYNAWRRAVQADAQYQITNSQVNRQQRVYFKVRENEGNYRFDAALNEYVPDPFGDFILRLVPTDDFIPVVELRSRLQLRLQPANVFRAAQQSWWQKWLVPLSTETLIRVEEKSRDPRVGEIYLLRLSRYQNPQYTLFGDISVRQDVYLFQNRRDFSLRYRLLTGKNLNNQLLEGEQRRRAIQHELRLNLALAKNLAGQFELISSREDKTFAQANRQDRFIRGMRFENDLSYRPQSQLELAVRAVIGRDSDRALSPSTNVTQFTVKPRTTYSIRGRGRFRAELEWTRVTAMPAGRIIPFELAQGNRLGDTFRWNLTFDYRMSQNLNAAFSYQGRDEPDRPRTLHLAKIEMRAFF